MNATNKHQDKRLAGISIVFFALLLAPALIFARASRQAPLSQQAQAASDKGAPTVDAKKSEREKPNAETKPAQPHSA